MPPAGGTGERPVLERCRRAVEQRPEAGLGLRADDRDRAPESTLPLSRSPVRRPSATPVSIGFGEPRVGKSAGPAT